MWFCPSETTAIGSAPKSLLSLLLACGFVSSDKGNLPAPIPAPALHLPVEPSYSLCASIRGLVFCSSTSIGGEPYSCELTTPLVRQKVRQRCSTHLLPDYYQTTIPLHKPIFPVVKYCRIRGYKLAKHIRNPLLCPTELRALLF